MVCVQAKEQMIQSLRESSQQDRRVYVGNLSYDVKWHQVDWKSQRPTKSRNSRDRFRTHRALVYSHHGCGAASPNRRDRMSMFDRGTPRDLAAAYHVQGYGPISPAQFQYPNGHHSFY
ncbi:hypothetical protein BU16DRAFT_523621 [Lophium mytilinum]|uniref:RRM domain-containing protein n=1 Tax=Lophium mytilinum TaxID=390894 RepID=A0A6A6R3E3_9PEZI|nr:hypothetical protein BU16DRAFT_523621 [Lophium mytilinum]